MKSEQSNTRRYMPTSVKAYSPRMNTTPAPVQSAGYRRTIFGTPPSRRVAASPRREDGEDPRRQTSLVGDARFAIAKGAHWQSMFYTCRCTSRRPLSDIFKNRWWRWRLNHAQPPTLMLDAPLFGGRSREAKQPGGPLEGSVSLATVAKPRTPRRVRAGLRN